MDEMLWIYGVTRRRNDLNTDDKSGDNKNILKRLIHATRENDAPKMVKRECNMHIHKLNAKCFYVQKFNQK